MKCVIVPVTPFQQNCSVLRCEQSGRLAVVDPGGDLPRIREGMAQLGGELEVILLTHGHMDHCSAADQLRRETGAPIVGPHEEERFLLESLPEWCERVGFPHAEAFEPDRWLSDGERVNFGDQVLEVYHCPGHTPGHVVFFHRGARLAAVGDVLFQGSVGRTDFPGGDQETLLESIREKLWPLGEDVRFVPGHGPTSTFGEERRSNPFVADTRLA